MCQTLFTDKKNKGKLVLVSKSSGSLLERLPVKKLKSSKSKSTGASLERIAASLVTLLKVMTTSLFILLLSEKTIAAATFFFLFSLNSFNAFTLFKTKVLNASSASRTNAQLYYNHSDCKVNLSSATWESFVYFLKIRQDCTVTVLSAASAALRLPGSTRTSLFSSQLSGLSTISNVAQQNDKNVLDMIIEKDWSGVFIHGLPKKSRKEAMGKLIRRNLKETWCKTYPVSQPTKVVLVPWPEGQQLYSQLGKLLTP